MKLQPCNQDYDLGSSDTNRYTPRMGQIYHRGGGVDGLTFHVVRRVCQERGGENMHAVLVEETEELCLFRFLSEEKCQKRRSAVGIREPAKVGLRSRAYVSGGQHVLWVDERAEQTHQLHGAAQLRVRVTDHLLDHHVYQQDVLLASKRVT